LRVLIVGPLLEVRGPIPRIVQLIAEGLRSRGCDVDIVHWGQRGAGESLLDKLTARPRDAARIVAGMGRGAYSLAFVHSAHDTRALLRELPLVLGANRRRLPVFYMFHGTPDRESGSVQDRAWRTLFGFLVRRMAGVLVLSQAEKRFIEGWYPGVHVWATRYPFKAEFAGFASVGNHQPTLIFVGRVIPQKGILELIQALPLVLRHTACRLVVCGDGSALPQARRLAETAGVVECVEFLGWQTRPATWAALASADVAVLPTAHGEGFPSAILEAMAVGLPIVTTRVGGMPDYLKEGVHARFVPPRDPPALAKALAQTLYDPALRARMGDANRALVQEFLPERITGEYLNIFHSRLGGD
jgi:glycosyltransferase involved in cell wall biosynthesis